MPTLTEKLKAAKSALKEKGINIHIHRMGDFYSSRGIAVTCDCRHEHHVNSSTRGLSIVTVAHYQIDTGIFPGTYNGKVFVMSFNCSCGRRLRIAYT